MDRKLKQQIPITIQAPQTHQSIYKEKNPKLDNKLSGAYRTK